MGGPTRTKRFTEEQMIGVHRDVERDGMILALCVGHFIAGTMFHRWRAKFGSAMFLHLPTATGEGRCAPT